MNLAKPGVVQMVESLRISMPSYPSWVIIVLAVSLPAAIQAVATASAYMAVGAIIVALKTSVAVGWPVIGEIV